MAPVDAMTKKGIMHMNADQLALQTTRAIVVHAVLDSHKGHSEQMHHLKFHFKSQKDDDSAKQPREVLIALYTIISQCDASCRDLVECILESRGWAACPPGDDYFIIFNRFLEALLTAHPSYLPLVVRHLLRKLRGISLEGEEQGYIFDRLHQTIQSVLVLVPTSLQVLMETIPREYPHASDEKYIQIAYVDNLLRIAEYAESLRASIFSLLIDRIIKIDVEIQVNLDDIEDDEEEDEDTKAEAMAVQWKRSMSGTILDDGDEDAANAQTEQSQRVVVLVDKLDAVLDLFLHRLMTTYFPYSAFDVADPVPSSVAVAFEALLQGFDTTILSTFRSRYTQFILFATSQSHPILLEHYIGLMLDRTLDASRSIITQQAGAAYLGSFLARAARINESIVRTVVGLLCSWLGHYLDSHEQGIMAAGSIRLGPFYSITQAVMYIFCFRWQELQNKASVDEVEDEGGAALGWFEPLLILHRVVLSRFNPLKVKWPIKYECCRCVNQSELLPYGCHAIC